MPYSLFQPRHAKRGALLLASVALLVVERRALADVCGATYEWFELSATTVTVDGQPSTVAQLPADLLQAPCLKAGPYGASVTLYDCTKGDWTGVALQVTP